VEWSGENGAYVFLGLSCNSLLNSMYGFLVCFFLSARDTFFQESMHCLQLTNSIFWVIENNIVTKHLRHKRGKV